METVRRMSALRAFPFARGKGVEAFFHPQFCTFFWD